jgi:diguanylate cyclase (GGDEF)-like protein
VSRTATLRVLKRRRPRRSSEQRAVRRFRLRLIATIVLTLAAIGVLGYQSMAHELRRQLTDTYTTEHQADAHAVELIGAGARSRAGGIREIRQLLDAVARRPNVAEAILIDRHGVVQASADRSLIGKTEFDRRIEAAIRDGVAYNGPEKDPAGDPHDFEYVSPVDLRGDRYAFEITRDHGLLDDHLRAARRTLILATLAMFLLGGGIFYFVGGRALMRSHRRALVRATRDGLTDLPNQRAFYDDLPHAVASATRADHPLALVLIDLDDFRFLNDRYGHVHGDSVLKLVAETLEEGRSADRAYRVGGDEFALLLPHTDSDGARTTAGRLASALKQAGVGISAGVSSLRNDQTAESLRAEADFACQDAKRRGGGRTVCFADIAGGVVLTTQEKVRSVRKLLEEEALTTHFQPIWNLELQTMLGIEALARPDSSYGLGPAEAFDIAAQIRRTHELDKLCVRRALKIAPDLPPGTLVFLNISPQTLDLDVTCDEWLAPEVEKAGLATESIVIEVTERFSGDVASVVRSLEHLQCQGFRLALDDVGTGNAGLEMLREVDVDFVKIDRSIVAAAPKEHNALAVLTAMATYARHTGSFVIAEGIEDEGVLGFIQRLVESPAYTGTVIQGGQGYGLGRPAPGLPDPAAGPPIPLLAAA